ncbi:MAG: serine/threonine protein kinase [Victivallales bacterium]|nr:serine/threonine protein kinase [Victivallales bacterium]
MANIIKDFFNWIRRKLGSKGEIKPGDILCGITRYEVIGEIGRGGQGKVYQVKILGASGFEKIAAVKVLRRNALDSVHIRSFVNEAKLASRLVQPNIVQIFHLDYVKGVYFCVLEYVDGITLHELLDFHVKIKRKLPYELAVFIVAQIARGLAYAHNFTTSDGTALNITHRDVCIRNIMIDREGVPKLMDFGLAKTTETQDNSERIIGKWGFMSPEQAITPSTVDFRSDIYSLGIVLFHLLSGESPRENHLHLKDRLVVIRENHLNWNLLPSDIPAGVHDILRRMLATNPDDRYSDTGVLLTDLEKSIYTQGYGPTIVTMSSYLHELMPGRFAPVRKPSTHSVTKKTQLIQNDDEKGAKQH